MKKLLVLLSLLFVGIANAVSINWMDGNTTHAQTTCNVGDDLILPSEPTAPRGYHFVGWVGAPAGYTKLEYIQSSGAQYINTGYNKTQVKSVEVVLSIVSIANTWNTFYGLAQDVQCAVSSKGFWHNYQKTSTVQATINTWYETKLDFSSRTLSVNGSNVATTRAGNNNDNIKLFNIDTTMNYASNVRIKSVKMYDASGNLVQHLVPVRQESDGVLGMYDMINRVFLRNAGTGVFTAGADTSWY